MRIKVCGGGRLCGCGWVCGLLPELMAKGSEGQGLPFWKQ